MIKCKNKGSIINVEPLSNIYYRTIKRCNVFLYSTYDDFCLRKIALRNTLRNKAPVIA